MKRRVELKLELDNGQFIPIKFEIPRTAGAFISLKAKNVSRIPFVKVVKVKWDHPVEEPQQVDWEEFKEFGTLHISRNPNQEFAVMLKGQNILRGATFRTLELSYEDLCEMVNYKESELFSVTEISVFF